MLWYEFIYNLIGTFQSVNAERVNDLKMKCVAWYSELKKRIEKDGEAGVNPWLLKLVHFSEEWWFQTALALIYIWAVKAVSEALSGKVEEDRDRN